MIPRYMLPQMAEVWSEGNKYRQWLRIEKLVCEALTHQGIIPREDMERIRNADFCIERIAEIEADTQHDVIAFTRAVSETLGPESRWIHYGLTSSDVVDTALSLVTLEAIDILHHNLKVLRRSVADLAKEHLKTPMMGRTHGIHAEITTFGAKLAVWVAELDRHSVRLAQAREVMAVGKISGAVGNYTYIPPFVEEYVCSKLGLAPAKASTQILQRDRHAQYVTTLALIGASLEKFATEIRLLQRTEVNEVAEPFGRRQKGSSAMPHKRNPIMSERVVGLSRVLRGHALTAMENVALWHERDISHSSTERIILPDASYILHYMLRTMNIIITGLDVNDYMMTWKTNGRWDTYSQGVMLKLIQSGLTREEAYDLVQEIARKAWENHHDFRELVCTNEVIVSRVGAANLERCFDPHLPLQHVGRIADRVGL